MMCTAEWLWLKTKQEDCDGMQPEALLPFLMQNSLSVGDFIFTGVSILLCTHYRHNNLHYYKNYTEYAEKALDTQFTSYKPLPLPAFY